MCRRRGHGPAGIPHEVHHDTGRHLLRRYGRRTGHRLCGHERRGGHQSHAHHISGHGPLHGCRHRSGLRRAGQRRLRLHLPQKQEPGHPERHHYDGHRASVYRGRQLHRQPGALPHHGKLLRDHDVPAGRQVHRPSRYDHQGGHAGCLRQKACRPVCGLRHRHRLHLWLRGRGRRHDDAADPDHGAGLRAEDRRGHQRVHYDLHRPDRCCLPLHDRRCAQLVRLGAVRGVHPAVGAHCRCVCQ